MYVVTKRQSVLFAISKDISNECASNSSREGGQSKKGKDIQKKTKTKMHTNLVDEGSSSEEEREEQGESEVDEVLTLEICKVEK